jgi:DNA topoisomerase I
MAPAKKKTPPVEIELEHDAELDEQDGDEQEDGKRGLKLVIVESPAKANTIRKILGKGYQVKASVGHIRDLPKKKIGVDVAKNFAPVYEVLADKMDVVTDLQASAKKASAIYLAADPDREGEAIAWHVAALLSSNKVPIKRIEFHEITKSAIKEAMKHPREIDIQRVDAQQARRILDRLVGYKLSPLLWRKVNKGLSAGRVQSVAVRIICEREAEILAFIPVEYWTIQGVFQPPGKDVGQLTAELSKINGKKAVVSDEATATRIVNTIKNGKPVIDAVTERISKRNPVAPFITSTLQREASNRFGYPVKKSMQIAQKLYEGVELGAGQTEGLITYMRTDSPRIADEAQAEAKEFILKAFGKEYYPETPRVYTGKGKNVQGAHEAIRPTSVDRTPEAMKPFITPEQLKLYTLIWNRFVSSQMESAQVKTKALEIKVDDVTLRASHSKVIFPGYMAIYRSEEDEAEEEGKSLPDLNKGDSLKTKTVTPKQHFTEPPPRYSESTLVKMLEELGIGRPSTYAATIGTIQDRGYVLKQEKSLHPTEVGKTVNQLLVEHFQNVVDFQFTADLEDRLDEIESEGKNWQDVVGDFYFPFETELKKAEEEMDKVVIIFEGVHCPAEGCAKPMQIKTSRWGSNFLGCTGYPDCKQTLPLTKDNKLVPDDQETDEICEKCQGPMVLKYGRYGEYLQCVDTTECKATRKIVKKTGVTCTKCNTHELVERKSRYGKFFYGCAGYPDCNFALWTKPTGAKCPDCNSLLVEKNLKRGHFEACSAKECHFTRDFVEPVGSPVA